VEPQKLQIAFVPTKVLSPKSTILPLKISSLLRASVLLVLTRPPFWRLVSLELITPPLSTRDMTWELGRLSKPPIKR
jgi:hypothetical protein